MTDQTYRRQQRAIGVIVLLLAAFSVAQTFHFQHRADSQQECFEDKFTALSGVSKLRAGLGERETAATRHVLMVYARAAGLVKDKADQELNPAQQKRFTRLLVAALVDYGETTSEIQRQRRLHPVPPFPIGACSDR